MPTGNSPADDAAADEPLYAANFSNEGILSTNDGDAWEVDDGELEFDGCESPVAHAAAPAADWTDVRVTARVRVDEACSDGQAGLRVRAADFDRCRMYACVIDLSKRLIAIVKKSGTCDRSPADTVKRVPGLATETWYSMQLTAAGRTIRCSVWGPDVKPTSVSYEDDTNDPIAAGTAALGGFGAKARFDDFEVRALGPRGRGSK